ncbi:MAG: hypothetical protein WA322_14740 [Pseudolabrys sp.]
MEVNARTWFTPKQKAEPRTPTACCDSISRAEQISHFSQAHLNGIALRLNQALKEAGLVLQ